MSRLQNAATDAENAPRANPEVEFPSMTEWQRNQIARAARAYAREDPLPPPMVTIRNMSPQFMEMAIALDRALWEMRTKLGRALLMRRYCQRRGVPMELPDRSGRKVPVPELARIEREGDEAFRAAAEMIRAIRKVKAVTGGDKHLKKRTGDLQLGPWLRQLDLVLEVLQQDQEELR